jgi:uncharacterized protein (TIRG00374 family)
VRKILIAIALLLGAVFLITRMGEVQAVLEILRKGDWRFILLALIIQIVWLINIAGMYRAIYQALGIDETIIKLVFLSAAAVFVNVVAPTAGMGGMAVFISMARQRGYSPARATVANVLFVLFDYIGFFCVLAVGLGVLAHRNSLNSAEIIASLILFSIALALAFFIYLGMRSSEELGRALGWIARTINRLLRPFIRRDYLSEARAYEFAHDAAAGLSLLRNHPRKLILPALLAVSNKALLILVLFLMFIAFREPYSIGTIIAGFSIGYLFLIVSPTPSGIGIVEGVLALALASLGVPFGAAAVLALAYRGITFWAPLLWGMLAFRWLHISQDVRTT